MGVWVAMTVDWVFRTALFFIRFVTDKWLSKCPVPEAEKPHLKAEAAPHKAQPTNSKTEA